MKNANVSRVEYEHPSFASNRKPQVTTLPEVVVVSHLLCILKIVLNTLTYVEIPITYNCSFYYISATLYYLFYGHLFFTFHNIWRYFHIIDID